MALTFHGLAVWQNFDISKNLTRLLPQDIEVWEIHDYVFTNVFKVHENHENFIP